MDEQRRPREQPAPGQDDQPNAQRTPAPTGNLQDQPSQAAQPSAQQTAAPPGNLQLAAALAGLYGSEQGSDCTVVFCQEAEQRVGRKRGREADEAEPLGDPLPGHTLVLRNVSERFAAQMDRWAQQLEESGAAADEPKKKQQQKKKQAAASAPTQAPRSGRPVLRVPLGSEAELPAARLALRFAYTGQVGGLGSIREALEVRRIGDYLAIEGCAAACTKWVADKLAEPVPSAGAAGSGPSGSAAAEPAAAEPPVLQLLGCTELWPSHDPGFAAVLTAASPQLLRHFRSVLATLNTPSLRRQLEALPAAGLEVLLKSDDLATDSEDSVLTLLAVWMETNWENTDTATRKRLAGLVRLARLSVQAMSSLVLSLAADYEAEGDASQAGWFPISVQHAAFVAGYVAASEPQRKTLKEYRPEAVVAGWLSTASRPQCVPAAGLSFKWSISKQALTAALEEAEPDQAYFIAPSFEGEAKEVMARGLAWSLLMQINKGADAAGLFLQGNVPTAYRVEDSRLAGELPRFASIVNARLVVYRWRAGAREAAYTNTFDGRSGTTVGWGWGSGKALALAPQPAAEAAGSGDPLARWAQYLGPEQEITGTLTLLPPS
ncbi:hypothetical protein HYH03_009348 [Edaphochlamys debaryana]|uniref:BACK domain-containing protein n=1 Tax=Edaphochlamys debaryana TaxID=47281 RepID=A0A836BXX5_9CHLO|nr:hypothetical protein HYH03_009348 [Edaphochlamys debaryana]|eukprot:KAG2492402.1 hypothetical protein HYH03_009348 [Edaphochlamys debaryana]